MKKTVVLGASLKEDSYANLAMHRLAARQIETVGIGLREGIVAGFPVYTGTPHPDPLFKCKKTGSPHGLYPFPPSQKGNF